MMQFVDATFQCLIQCRKDVCQQLALPLDSLELSMGMSHDFEHAVSSIITSVNFFSILSFPSYHL